jgi:predicted DNA binding protein
MTLYKRELPISEITESLKISKSTLYQYLRNEGHETFDKC